MEGKRRRRRPSASAETMVMVVMVHRLSSIVYGRRCLLPAKSSLLQLPRVSTSFEYGNLCADAAAVLHFGAAAAGRRLDNNNNKRAAKSSKKPKRTQQSNSIGAKNCCSYRMLRTATTQTKRMPSFLATLQDKATGMMFGKDQGTGEYLFGIQPLSIETEVGSSPHFRSCSL